MSIKRKYSNANTGICFDVRATALRPRLHIEGFQLSTKEPTPRNYNLQFESKQLHSHSSTQEEGTKPKHKAKKSLQLGDPMITNNTW